VAKQDEVEPTEASDAAEPSDATDEVTADQESAGQQEEPGEGAEVADADDADDAEPVDEFDEIVRDSGVHRRGEEDPSGDAQGPTDNGAAKVLEPAGVAATTTGSRTGARGRAPARTHKTTATAKRDQPVKPERTTPLKFVRQSVGELRKVVYPTGQQLINYFIVVLVFVLFVIAYVSLLDLGFGAAIFRIFS
jgi:preprotein translocase subunit SecE